MIVVDANVIVYATIASEKTPLARRLRRLDPLWSVPSLCRHELASALSSHIRHGDLSEGAIPAAWDAFFSAIAGNEHDVHLQSAVRLAVERGISAYDAQYAVLARELNAPLVTEDKRLRSRCPDETRSMQEHLQSVGG